MAFWSKVRNSQLKLFTAQFRSSYFRTNPTSFLTQTSRNPHLEIPKLPSEFFQHNNVRFFAAPVQVKPKVEKKDKGPRLNEKIPHRIIRVVDPNEEHHVLSRTEALERAKKLELDLVEVDRHADPPVCRLMDFHKERYVKQVKEKERAKSKVTVKSNSKEVRFSPKCEKKDLVVKANTVKRLMESGYRVKCMAMGSEDQDLAGLLSRFTPLIEDLSIIESGPIVEKKQAYVVVRHAKFGRKKGGKKVSNATGDMTNEVPKVTSSNHTHVQCEEHIYPAESEGESDIQGLSDEDDKSIPSVHGRERTAGLVSNASEDFERVFNFTDDVNKAISSPSYKGTKPIDASHLSSLSCPDPHSSYGSSTHPKPNLRVISSMHIDKARLGPLSPHQPQSRHTMNVSPSRQGGPVVKYVNASPNEVPRQEQPYPDPPKPTPSYGMFSGLGAGNPIQKQGLGTGMNANMNRNPVDFRTAPTSEGVSVDKARLGAPSPPQSQPRHTMNAFPPRPERPVSRSANASPNEVPRQEKPCPDPPKPTPSYGIFSGLGASNPSQLQGLGTGMSANMNRSPVDLETRHPRFAGVSVDQASLGHQSPPQSQSQDNMNVSPSRTDGLVFNSMKPYPNEVSGQKHQWSDPPKPTPTYGIFSGSKTSNLGKQGLGSEMNASMKRNPVDSQPLSRLGGVSNDSDSDSSPSQPDGGQRQNSQGGFGIFSRDSGSPAAPGRVPENQAKAQR